MEPLPLIDSISAAAGCGARSHQLDSGDGESDLERPCHQLAFIDGIAHWKSMGFEAGSGSRIPSNARSRTGPWHPLEGPRQGPLALTWECARGLGQGDGHPQNPSVWVPQGTAPQHLFRGVPQGPITPIFLHGGCPNQHPHLPAPQDMVAPSILHRSPLATVPPGWYQPQLGKSHRAQSLTGPPGHGPPLHSPQWGQPHSRPWVRVWGAGGGRAGGAAGEGRGAVDAVAQPLAKPFLRRSHKTCLTCPAPLRQRRHRLPARGRGCGAPHGPPKQGSARRGCSHGVGGEEPVSPRVSSRMGTSCYHCIPEP